MTDAETQWLIEQIEEAVYRGFYRALNIPIPEEHTNTRSSKMLPSEPQICDQCSRKLEDGALYEDHAAQPNKYEIARELDAQLRNVAPSDRYRLILSAIEEATAQAWNLPYLQAATAGTVKKPDITQLKTP